MISLRCDRIMGKCWDAMLSEADTMSLRYILGPHVGNMSQYVIYFCKNMKSKHFIITTLKLFLWQCEEVSNSLLPTHQIGVDSTVWTLRRQIFYWYVTMNSSSINKGLGSWKEETIKVARLSVTILAVNINAECHRTCRITAISYARERHGFIDQTFFFSRRRQRLDGFWQWHNTEPQYRKTGKIVSYVDHKIRNVLS